MKTAPSHLSRDRLVPVNIQTKSKLALRDLDLFQDFEDIEVGFTITTDDESVARIFEPRASAVAERIKALQQIHEKGIKTFAFIGPLLPGNPERLVSLLEGIAERIYIDRMNYMSTIREFYHQQGIREAATERFFSEYRERLVREMKRRKMRFEVLF